VIQSLSERADGMYVDYFTLMMVVQTLNRFRWVFCQLEVLRDCLPPSVRRTLDELPESLDETYERILKEIKKPNRDHARRLLSCLVAAVRPLQVEELSEVLAVDYEDQEGIPRLNPNWRWEDQEQALLTSCSSLIAIVESDGSRVVQFSHFSVREFLTSNRLFTSSGDVLRYYIALEPAHTILAQACMSALLRSDDSDRIDPNGVKTSSQESQLAGYAARHWVAHAQYENVSSYLQKAMEYLFDLDKPYFSAWLDFLDIDNYTVGELTFYQFTIPSKSNAVPLYYAALCGLQELVEHLILKYPQHVDAIGGHYVTPLVAALAGEHFHTAKILYDNGAHPNVRGYAELTPLHSAAYYGHLQMVEVLLGYKADVNARDAYDRTPLYSLLENIPVKIPVSDFSQSGANVARVLLEHGADVNACSNRHITPLHLAVRSRRSIDIVRVLLEHGASVDAEDDDGKTPFQAARDSDPDIIKLLSEHGAK
jgi:hypothetical protein